MPRTYLYLCAAFAILFATHSADAGLLRFSAKTIDTATLPPLTTDQIAPKSGTDGPVTFVVQFSRPIARGDVRRLERAGATVHLYLPDYAYLITAKTNDLQKIQAVSGVTWSGLLPKEAKLSRQVADAHAKAGAAKASTTPVSYIVLSVDERAVKELEGKGHSLLRSRKTAMGWHETKLAAPLSKAFDLSEMNSVFRVEAAPEYELHGERAIQSAAGNLNASGTAPSGPGYADWLNAQGLNGGFGTIVQVQDDGLDKGIATNLPGTAHVDIVGRIAGISNATADLLGDSRAGHGQINAGIIMGNATGGTADGAGFLRGLGVAPNASVFATKIFRNDGSFDIGSTTFTELAEEAENVGARFSNNSWGASVDGEYTSDSAEFDALTRDANPSEPGNQPMTYFFSAGNDGPANRTIGSPATAKNVIAVGASENSDADGKDGCNVNAASSNNNRDLAAFSSRGPTIDDRFGISIVTVGTHVSGPASTVSGYDGTGVCDQFWPLGQSLYARSSGTSHSAPIACGAGVLIHELFSTQLAPLGHPAAPSPALVRAILTNTATSLQGGSDGNGGTLGHIPNNRQGWGAVNLNMLFEMKHALFTLDQQHLFSGSGQTFEIALRPVDASKPVKITLAWTDAPAAPGTALNLVNDLDLEVVSGSTLFRGNVFTSGFSTLGGNPDRRNNLEAVYIAGTTNEVVTVRVKAYNIAGDGVPNIGSGLDQDFALFAWNATDQSPQGIVHVSPELVSCDDTISVTVSDSDLRGDGSVDVAVTSSTGDQEVVTLNETDLDSGVFTAEVVIGGGAPAVNGMVEVSDGATIDVAYADASDDNGQAVVVSDTALVDCTPPSIFDVAIDDSYSTQATVTFSTDTPATSAVHFGASCNATSQTRSGGDGTTEHTAVLTGLTPSTPYYFVVRAIDAAGNETVTETGACFSFTTPERADFFTQSFSAGDNDLHNQSLLFTPNGSISFYGVCRTTAFIFPSNPTTGTVLNLTDDSFVEIPLTNGATFPFYSVNYSKLYVGSNGYVTFGNGQNLYAESLQDHFSQPRISALFDDLVPDSQHPVRYQQFADRVAISWVNVPEFGTTNANNAQIELFFDGRIRITHLQVDSFDGLSGLSKGLGIPADFMQSDLSAYAACDTSYTIAGSVTAPGGAPLEGVTLNGLPGNPVTDANGVYSVVVPGGFSGTVTPLLNGFTFAPVSRAYANIAANLTSENYAASQARLEVSPLHRDAGPAAATLEFDVENIGTGAMAWTASVIGGSTWASITSGASGTDSGVVRVAIAANTTATPRNATIRITAAGATGSPAEVTITQSAAPALAVSPLSRNVGYAATATSFVVSNSGGGSLNWSASVISGNAWLSITSGDSGTNGGVIGLAVQKNTGAQRAGTVRITAPGAVNPQIDVTVTQSAAPRLVITPTNRNLPAGAGVTTFDVSVEGGSGVAWTASVTSGTWIAITSAPGGTDAGQIQLTYGSNSGTTTRDAIIRFTSSDASNAPIDVTVSQTTFAQLQVQAPNGGESYRRGQNIAIRWKTEGSLKGKVRVDLYRNGILVTTIKSAVKNDGRASWRVPSNYPRDTTYQIRVSSVSNAALFDLSDGFFAIR